MKRRQEARIVLEPAFSFQSSRAVKLKAEAKVSRPDSHKAKEGQRTFRTFALSSNSNEKRKLAKELFKLRGAFLKRHRVNIRRETKGLDRKHFLFFRLQSEELFLNGMDQDISTGVPSIH